MHSTKLRTACVAAGLALVALAGVMPAAADAGTFTIHSCKLPDGSPAATGGWTPDGTSPFLPQIDDCSQGAGLRTQMQGVGISDGVERAWTWTAAPNTVIQEAHVYRAFSLTTGDTTATPTVRVIAGATTIETHGSHPATGDNTSHLGSYAEWALPENHVPLQPAPAGATSIAVALGCHGVPRGTCPATGAVSDLRIQAARFTLLDALSPSITAVGGSLTTGGEKAGTQTLRFSATDAGAGIYRTFLDVDGSTVATSTPNTNTGHCADAVPANSDPYEFQHAQPCPLAVSNVDVPLDTTTLTDGTHTVQLRVEDAAGNETSAYGPTAIVVRWFTIRRLPAAGAAGR